jgi:peroxiredoxin-like protein
MNIEHNYEVDINWMRDRIGILYSPELNDEIQVATPPQFLRGVEKVWSPEHLFTAAVISCLMTTFLSIAESSKLEFKEFSSKAFGKLEVVEGKYQMSSITLIPSLTIYKEEDQAKALRILHRSEAACLISNSIKSRIILQPEITVV